VYLALAAAAGKRHWTRVDSAPEEWADGIVQIADAGMEALAAVLEVGQAWML
jgi:hypothetical protein